MLKAVYYFLRDVLTGPGIERSVAQFMQGVAVFHALINMRILPAYSWRAAVQSSIASEALQACGDCTAVFPSSRHSEPLPDRTKLYEIRVEA